MLRVLRRYQGHRIRFWDDSRRRGWQTTSSTSTWMERSSMKSSVVSFAAGPLSRV